MGGCTKPYCKLHVGLDSCANKGPDNCWNISTAVNADAVRVYILVPSLSIGWTGRVRHRLAAAQRACAPTTCEQENASSMCSAGG
jgi:hypothetical protein